MADRKSPTSSASGHTKSLWAAALVASLWMLGSLGGCEIEEPALPTFSTRLTLPIGQERIDMAEVIEDEDYVVVGPDDFLNFSIQGDPDTVTFDMDLTAEIEAADIDVQVGNYVLDVADSTYFAFTLGDMYPEAVILDGMSVVVPAFDFDLSSGTEQFDGLVSADVASGQLVVTLTNNLPVPVSGTSSPAQIRATLIDAGTGGNLAEVVFLQEILPDSQATAMADLAGVILPGNVAVQLTGGSPGSTGQVTIHADDSVELEAKLVDLQVNESVAVINPQNFDGDYQTALPDTIRVVEAEILSGVMNFDLTNGLPIPCEAQILWHEIVNPAGYPLVTTYWLPAFTTAQQSLDLAGLRIYSSDGNPLSELNITVTVTSPGSGGVPVHLLAAHSLTAAVAPTLLSIGTITGSIPEQTFTVDPLEKEIDLPDELDNISLTAASLVVRVGNGTGMPAQISFTVTGTAEDGSKATLDMAAAIAPAPALGLEETVVILDESNSDIVDFINSKPDTITLEGDVIVGGETVIGTIRPNDIAVLNWEIVSPIEVIIGETVISRDPDDLDYDEDIKEIIRDHAISAQAVTEVTNHLPIAVDITIYVSDDTTTITTEPLLTIDLHNVAAGQLDPVLHTVAVPTVSRPVVTLTTEDIQVFGLPERLLYTLLEVTIPGSEDPVRFRVTDYVEVAGLVSLEVLVTE